MKDDKLYLIHIVESIERIEEYVIGGKAAFLGSTLIQDAVVRNLQIIGQSAKNISDEIKIKHPQIDWRGIVAFRNTLVHDYLEIDLDQVWTIVSQDIPDLKVKIQSIESL